MFLFGEFFQVSPGIFPVYNGCFLSYLCALLQKVLFAQKKQEEASSPLPVSDMKQPVTFALIPGLYR